MSSGESFINYGLLKEIEAAYRSGVFPDMGVEDEDEERYVSELDRRMSALDDKSVYVAVRAFANEHRKTLIKALEHIREGEKDG